MNVADMYAKTKRWMYEKLTEEYWNEYVFEVMNHVLAELFDENNMCRMWNGKNPLDEIPTVSALTDELTYEEEYLLHVIPLGLCAYFQIDDDLNRHSIYMTLYNNARVKHQKMLSTAKIEEAINAVEG